MLKQSLSIASVVSVAAFVLLIGLGSAGVRRDFAAPLSGRSVVEPIQTEAFGQVELRLEADGRALTYRLVVGNIENIRSAHIHLAHAGIEGPAVATLYPGPRLEGRFSGLLAEGRLDAADLAGSGMSLDQLLAEIRAGCAYVAIQTDQRLSGEIRGQLH